MALNDVKVMATHYSFRLGDVFKADSIEARWVVTLSMLANDLIYISVRLESEAEQRAKDGNADHLYYFWMSSSHLREGMKVLQEGRSHPVLRAFVATLKPETEALFNELCAFFEPWDDTSWVKKRLIPLRAVLFHYPSVDSPELGASLAALQNAKTSFRLSGTKYRDTRAVFADDVRSTLATNALQGIGGDLEIEITRLSEVTPKVAKFARDVLRQYLERIPSESIETTITEASE